MSIGPLFLACQSASGGYFSQDVNTTLTAIVADGQNCTGTLVFLANGTWTWDGDTLGTDDSGVWWKNASTMVPPGARWSVRIVQDSGDDQSVGGLNLNQWYALSSNRTWTFNKTTAGGPDSTNGVYTVSFSNDGGSSVYDSVEIDDITLTEQAP